MIGRQMPPQEQVDEGGKATDHIQLKNVGVLVKNEQAQPVIVVSQVAIQSWRSSEHLNTRIGQRCRRAVGAVPIVGDVDLHPRVRLMFKERSEDSMCLFRDLG